MGFGPTYRYLYTSLYIIPIAVLKTRFEKSGHSRGEKKNVVIEDASLMYDNLCTLHADLLSVVESTIIHAKSG